MDDASPDRFGEPEPLIAAQTDDRLSGLRVAVVHYWLVNMRGGERVLEEILKLFPQADLFTHVAVPKNLSEEIRRHRLTESFIARLPGARRHYPKYLALMPRALEELDLSQYDLVISSESGPSKGVVVPPGAAHVCYCHSPMRYIWDQYHAYRSDLGFVERQVFGMIAHRLRQWDVTSAARVDAFAANSSFVAERIRRYYNRRAEIIHPPVDLSAFTPEPRRSRSHFLFVSELVRYKRADLAIAAFKRLGLPLVVVGSGEDARRLQSDASANITFMGRVSNEELADLYRSARALVFPALEDFGIVPLEAMACGVPVIAYAKGGALDSVRDGQTGLHFHAQSEDALIDGVERFVARENTFDPQRIARHAAGFSPAIFRRRFAALVERTVSAPAATLGTAA